jgi:hypothetical protein
MLIVSNEDTALKVYVRDGAGVVCNVVFPETSVAISTTGLIEVFNPNGAPVQVAVSEIVFSKAAAT